MRFKSDGKQTPNSVINVELGNIKKFEYFGEYKDITPADLTALQAVEKPTFTAADGTCDNFALEYHLKVKFEYKETDNVPSYVISKVVIDIVYGTLTPEALTSEVSISRKTSVTFYENDNFRMNSGSPGYSKGMPLKVGTERPLDETIPQLS